jgi:SAM-dependent methyltransferase
VFEASRVGTIRPMNLTVRRAAQRVWRLVEGTPVAPLFRRARRSTRILRRGAGRSLARAGWRVSRPGALEAMGADAESTSWRKLPHHYRIEPPPRDVGTDWPEPPQIDEAASIVRSIYDTGERPPLMDLALLEALNEEYRSRPLVPEPLKYDQASREERARRRLLDVHRSVDVADKRVLELGCGGGFEVWYLSHQFGSDAWGVDVNEVKSWARLEDDRTHYVCADLASEQPFEAGFFDRIYSFSVLEHVVHPWAMLNELFRILRPGGLAYLNANLHRGPRASHIYRELYFPFPHLLFSDDVIREFREKHSGRSAGASWVNRLTWSQYEDYFRQIGFVTLALRFLETPLDEAFYDRFDNILGRYPRWDLTKDFFNVVLEKPKR